MQNIIYLNDKELILIRNQEYIYEFNSLSKGAINNVSKFMQELNAILKERKINRGIVGEDLKVYLNEPLSPINETFYKGIFNDLGFNNIEIHSIKNFLDEKDTIYLISNKYSQFIYFNNNYNELSNIEMLTNINFKNPIKIFGNNPHIDELKNNLKFKTDIKIYIFYPPEKYIINLLKKIM